MDRDCETYTTPATKYLARSFAVQNRMKLSRDTGNKPRDGCRGGEGGSGKRAEGSLVGGRSREAGLGLVWGYIHGDSARCAVTGAWTLNVPAASRRIFIVPRTRYSLLAERTCWQVPPADRILRCPSLFRFPSVFPASIALISRAA